MNLMVTNANIAVVGIILPIEYRIDGVEADIMNVSGVNTTIMLPIDMSIDDDTAPHIYYRSHKITHIELFGSCNRCRLKAFIHPKTNIDNDGHAYVSYCIMNTSDFELVSSGSGNSYFVKSLN